MQSPNSFHIAASFAVFCTILVGCTQQSGPPLAKVFGTVTLDGQPVQNAGLEFIAEAGGVAYGKTDASGRYQMSFGASRTGAIIGKNRVRITAGDKVTVGDKKYESMEVFPKKYNTDSEQLVEVVRGSNRLDFTCQSGNFQPRQSISRGGN
jgi:hypothetical protein